MKKITILLMLSLLSSATVANEDLSIITPIDNMFDAMREHDGEKLLAQFVEGAILDRATKENTIKTSDLAKFAEFISKTSKHLDEQLFNIRVHQSGNLASAWTPFAFYLDGKLSHCGVNSFQLIKQQEQWKIRYLIDNAHLGDCEKFISDHKKKAS